MSPARDKSIKPIAYRLQVVVCQQTKKNYLHKNGHRSFFKFYETKLKGKRSFNLYSFIL